METIQPRMFRYAGKKKAALRDNIEHNFAAGYALGLFRRHAVYSFIPKNGCSTLRYSVARANGVLGEGDRISWIHRNNAVFRVGLADLVRADYAFVVLRSPFSRLASCFLDKFVDAQGAGLVYAKRNACELDTITFEQFVRSLQTRDELRADQHWRPQVDFLVYRDYDDWFALERFPDAVRRLAERIGFVVHDARALTDHGVDQLEQVGAPGEFARTTVADVALMKQAGRAPSTRSLFSEELRDAVARLYAADMALYERHIGTPVPL